MSDNTSTASSAAPFDARGFRNALGRFPTGVAIVTTRDAQGGLHGLTVNSFTSASLEPPLILWSLRNASRMMPKFLEVENFAVNLLAEEHLEDGRLFAVSGPREFNTEKWLVSNRHGPLLINAAATFNCRTASRVPAGDHMVFLGEVQTFSYSSTSPLLFHAGRFFESDELLGVRDNGPGTR
ncbi:MAG: flavin reductase [Betaproteobacteria bacterium]|nr:flavin reductase [Betaproteobacteria bacterium]